MKSARARQVHRALSAVARCTLYTNVNVEIRFDQAPTSNHSCYQSCRTVKTRRAGGRDDDNVFLQRFSSLESDDMSETSVSVIIFSPATGLPLQIDCYHVHPIVNITWKSTCTTATTSPSLAHLSFSTQRQSLMRLSRPGPRCVGQLVESAPPPTGQRCGTTHLQSFEEDALSCSFVSDVVVASPFILSMLKGGQLGG